MKVKTKKREIEEVLEKGVEKIYPSKKKLKKKLLSGERLRIYQGFDPTAPSLHIGHFAGVIKLSQFQKLGHEVIFLVGDFTGMIGDPTDKKEARQKLTRKDVLKNCQKWKGQIKNILPFSGPNPAKLKFNSQWLDEKTFKDLLETTSNFTVQQMIQRDFFQERIKKEKPIYLHEFLYPVAQALDSVEMNVDLEVGGTDQTFNMLCGRDLLKKERGKEKFVLTTKLLVDKKGKKVGKTTGNAVFLDLPADKMYGRIMNFPDEVIPLAFELLTLKKRGEIKREFENPMKAKKDLAREITALVKGKKKAEKAEKEFERVFQKNKKPKNIKKEEVKEEKVFILDLLTNLSLADSKTEAKRLIKQGGVKIDGKRVKKWKKEVKIEDGMVVQVGKRNFREIKKKSS